MNAGSEVHLRKAARVAIARAERAESPQGEWRARLWYPTPEERRACCEAIKPTAANRQALESHCRTQAHVARLFDVRLPELRRAVKRFRVAGDGHPARRGGRAQALYEASRGAHGAALRELQDTARSFERILPGLISAAEMDEGLMELLEEATVSIDRLKSTLEYYRKVAATYDAAREVHAMAAVLFEPYGQEVPCEQGR